jgi:hypothetical protein
MNQSTIINAKDLPNYDKTTGEFSCEGCPGNNGRCNRKFFGPAVCEAHIQVKLNKMKEGVMDV